MARFFRLLLTAEETVSEAAEGGTADFSGMSNMLETLLIVMVIGCGIYALYTAIRLRRTYMLFPNKFLYPGNCAPDDCADEDGFIDFILPRMTILGIAMLVIGALLAANHYLLIASGLLIDLATVIIPFGWFVWYIIVQRKAAKLFWGV